MPLPDGQKLLDYLDPQQRPVEDVVSFDEVATIPARDRQARRAHDATRWCLTCDITLRPDGTKPVCDECAPKLVQADNRRRQQESRIRVRENTQRELGRDVTVLENVQVEQLRAKMDALTLALGRATAQFPRSNRTGDWVDDLMMAVKDLERVMAETLPPARDQ
ncbi:MAG: hypothetical protein HHJ11_13780 [Phycicoccus sp.]|nr:hypothetical protein [Phycicoccus sp.]NMM33199.1 hypothetical protein [Phycicoccus sp.]